MQLNACLHIYLDNQFTCIPESAHVSRPSVGNPGRTTSHNGRVCDEDIAGQRVADIETPFFAFAIRERGLGASLGEKNREARRMAVHDGLFVGSVVHAEQPHMFAFKSDAVRIKGIGNG